MSSSCLGAQVPAHRRDLLQIRLRLRSRARSLHLPGGQDPDGLPSIFRHAPVRRHQGRHAGLYRGSRADCGPRRLKARCCPNTPVRKIPRDVDEDVRDLAHGLAATPDYEASRHRRKKVEMLFAHLKRILKVSRLRLRGPNGARDEFLLAATAQNLRKLAMRRAPPRAELAPA